MPTSPENRTPPHHSHTAVLYVVIFAASIFALLSFIFIVSSIKNEQDQITGRVVTVSPNEITIVNAHGSQTRLLIGNTTHLNGMGMVEHTDIHPGMFIYSRGENVGASTFIPRGIRIIKTPK